MCNPSSTSFGFWLSRLDSIMVKQIPCTLVDLINAHTDSAHWEHVFPVSPVAWCIINIDSMCGCHVALFDFAQVPGAQDWLYPNPSANPTGMVKGRQSTNPSLALTYLPEAKRGLSLAGPHFVSFWQVSLLDLTQVMGHLGCLSELTLKLAPWRPSTAVIGPATLCPLPTSVSPGFSPGQGHLAHLSVPGTRNWVNPKNPNLRNPNLEAKHGLPFGITL